MTAYENITEVLDRIEKVSKKGLNYAIELEDIEQLQEAQQQVKNNDLLHSVSQQRELLLAWEEYSCKLEYLTPNYEVLEENIKDFLANNCG